MKFALYLAHLFLCIFLFSSCDQGSAQREAEDGASSSRPVVYAVNYPLYYYAKRIGGEEIDLRYPVPDGVTPSSWTPDLKTVQLIQESDALLLNGPGYSKWSDQISLPFSILFDTTQGFVEQLIPLDKYNFHSHGRSGAGDYDYRADPMVWLDPELAQGQVVIVKDALLDILSERDDLADLIEENSADLMREIQALGQSWDELAGAHKGRAFLSLEPVYSYLARRCAWDIRALDGAESSIENAKIIWCPSMPPQKRLHQLRALGIQPVVIDPGETRPKEGDWMSVMKGNLDRLRRVLSSAGELSD